MSNGLRRRIKRGTLRVLAVTNLYPTPQMPTLGTFMEQQIKGLRQIGLDVDVMFINRAQRGVSAYLRLDRHVCDRVLSFQPDVIHVMYGGIMADRITCTVQDRPVVVSFCGTDLLGQPLVGCLRKSVSALNVWASWRAARRAEGIVVKSKNLQNALPEDVDHSKVRIIPNGVDLERFKLMKKSEARQILGWRRESAVALFVTVRGHPRKRPGLAKEAVSRIRGCDRPVDFRIMQGVPHEEVPLWLNASDVLLLTSFHEGGVNTVKEAMACNLPIVSVDVGDVRERLEGVRSCAIVKPDPDALARALGEVLRFGGRSNGRDRLSELTLVAVAERLNQLYMDVLRDRWGEIVDFSCPPPVSHDDAPRRLSAWRRSTL